MTRAERLAAFLAPFRDCPWTWGVNDCCAWPAAWVRTETGSALDLPRYTTEAEARTLMAGGLEPLWDNAMLSVPGARRSYGSPEIGDVGLLRLSIGVVGAIWSNGGYAYIRTTAGLRGLAPREPAIVAAWHVPEP
ncbi:DUF6950 family protein [Salinarimonas sp. NSM]|uniref:DUF6950 family protein n=1 Tax=Salinarimonas sp. NSM TaxID=3458003 RepID=UPI004036E270